ncbi:MAG: PAS domain S-box protein [Sedimenticola sp.]
MMLPDRGRQRFNGYLIVGIGLTFGFILLRDVPWQSSAQFHTILEIIATLLALMVGIVGLVRYYSRPTNTFLFIGTGFLGTSFLDGYHAVVTSTWIAPLIPSTLSSLIPWSWVASRIFLAVMLLLGLWASRREKRLGERGRLDHRLVYFGAILFSLACFLFFALMPLPIAYYPDLYQVYRPQEFIPASIFLLALVGYLRDGRWRNHALEHWLVLALIISVLGQTVFMPYSHELFDLEFDMAHFLKKASYICVLTGLLINMLFLYRQADQTVQLQQEIGERKQVEKELGKSEQRFRALVETSSDWIWEVDTQGRYVYVSPIVEKMLGYRPEEVLGKTPFDFMPEEEVQRIAQTFMAVVEAQQPFSALENVNRHKDGHLVTLETSGTPIIDAGGNFLGFRGVDRDISERKLLEQKEREAHDQLLTVFEAVDEPIYVSDPESHELIYINHCFKKYWGTDALGTKCYKTIQNRDTPCPYCTNDKIFGDNLGQTYIWEMQNEINEIWFRCVNKAIRWTDDRMMRFQFASNINEIKQAEQERSHYRENLEREVQRRTRELETANKDLEGFSYSVSHDLRSPLRAIDGFVSILEEDYAPKLDEEGLRLLGIVSENANKMGQLIDDILAFSRAGRLQLEQVEVDMNTLVKEVWAGLKQERKDRNYQFRHSDLQVVSGDIRALRQVWQNLLANAIKFSRDRDPAVIEITVQTDNDMIYYTVKDNGVGFNPNYVNKLFILFQRLHGMDEFEGTGVGLAIVKRVIQKHGGSIDATGILNEGASFRFTLPRFNTIADPAMKESS